MGTAAEVDELSAFVARLANDSGQNRNFYRFQQWLDAQPPYEVIIDAANVAFNSQRVSDGKFQFLQVHAVVKILRDLGRRTLVVLHPKWLREDQDLSVPVRTKRMKHAPIKRDGHMPEPPPDGEDSSDEVVAYPHDPITDAERNALPGSPCDIVRTWKEWGALVVIPRHDCDDWYWLYAALNSARRGVKNIQVVSNDQMRDHFNRMHRPRTFFQWQSRHVTKVHIWSESPEHPDDNLKVTLSPPLPYSPQFQVTVDGSAWHFPVPIVPNFVAGKLLSSRTLSAAEQRWLVAWTDP